MSHRGRETLRLKILFFAILLGTGARRNPAQSWERLGPQGGMVLSLAADSGGVLYLGTSDGHVFASQDRGAHWTLRGRVGVRTDAVVAQFAVSSGKAGRIFAAVWFRDPTAGGGVFRSEDGGATWQSSGLQGEAVRALEFAPSQPELLVAGTRSGVFRSPDAGGTWERISPLDDSELRNVDSVAVDPAEPRMIYAGTYHLPWKTTDGGKTWKAIASGLIDDSDIMSMRVDATNPARVYLSACSGIYRSDNRGESWTKLQGIPYAARRTQAIVQDPQKPLTLYAATTEGLWMTRDAGENWERTTPKDWVVNGVAVLPGQGNAPARVVLGTEAQGILVSEDAGKTFAAANEGFTHQVAKQLLGDPRDASHLLVLLERNGVELLESRDAGQSWGPMNADAGKGPEEREWSTNRIEHAYGSPWGWIAQLSNGTFWRQADSGGNWQPWNLSAPAQARVKKKERPKTSVPRRFTVAPRGLMAFSASSAFVPTAQGLLRCNQVARCEPLAAFSRVAGVTAVWISPDGQLFLVASEGKIGISKDAGKSAVWRDLPVDLRCAREILWDSQGRSSLFLATDRGLYFSRDAAEHWMLSQGGLPSTVVEHVWRASGSVLTTLEQGGVYISPDGTGNWTRLDRDGERSRMNGMAETTPGQWVFGSQSEGVLRWESGTAQ